MTVRPLLSICIPTYQREGFLRECLASIDAAGLMGDIEVVVSDNASTDRTVDVLEEYAAKLPLRWIIQETNIGADRNFDAVVALAGGEYCWLLGSDDVLEPDAVSKMVAALRSQTPDILHFGYVQTDITLKRLYTASPPTGRVGSSPEALADYFGSMPNLSLMFTFMSSFAFRRRLWMDRRDQVQAWVGSFYIHMLTMHAALADGASLVATSDCLVLARGGNPNPFNTVPGRFTALDATTMKRLIVDIYSDAPVMWRGIGRTFRRTYTTKSLIYIAANGGLHYLRDVMDPLLRLGYSPLLLKSLIALERMKLLGLVKRSLDLRRAARAKISPKVL